MQLHDGAEQPRGVALATLFRRSRDGREADQALTETQDVQSGDGLPRGVLKQVTRATQVIRIAVLSGAILVEGLILLPSVIAECQHRVQILGLHETQTAHRRKALAAVFDHALEHRLRADPRAGLRIIIQAAIDHLRRKILGMRRDPKPEVMVALVVAVEGPGHGYTGGMVTRGHAGKAVEPNPLSPCPHAHVAPGRTESAHYFAGPQCLVKGCTMTSGLPTTSWAGTSPQPRESKLLAELSPMAK